MFFLIPHSSPGAIVCSILGLIKMLCTQSDLLMVLYILFELEVIFNSITLSQRFFTYLTQARVHLFDRHQDLLKNLVHRVT